MRLEQDPIHRHKDVLTHTIAVVAKSPPELKVRLAALFHDVGKPRTRSIGDNGVSLPPPRGRRCSHDADAHEGPAVQQRDGRRRHQARLPAPADAHLPAGLDRLGRAPLRPRRRTSARPNCWRSLGPTAPHATGARPRRWSDGSTSWRSGSKSWPLQEELDAIRPDIDGRRGDGTPRHPRRTGGGGGPGASAGAADASVAALSEQARSLSWTDGGPDTRRTGERRF